MRTLLIAFFLGTWCMNLVNAQFTGPRKAQVNEIANYSHSEGLAGGSNYYYWETSGGDILSQTETTCQVRWTTKGVQRLYLMVFVSSAGTGYSCTSVSVRVGIPDEIKYTYDASGNRDSTKLVVVPISSKAGRQPGEESPFWKPGDMESSREDDEQLREVLVYPNPTKGELTVHIKSSEDAPGSRLVIYNLSGKEVWHSQQNTPVIPVDISSYPNGIYLMRMQVGKETKEWKIIKE